VPDRSWVPVPAGSPFPVQNLPYGVFSAGVTAPGRPAQRRLGVAIGESVLDLTAAAGSGLLTDPTGALAATTLNPLLAEGPQRWRQLRAELVDLLTAKGHRERVQPLLLPQAAVVLHLPWEVADYVDFYSSLDHAQNIGRIFRPDQEPLAPSWRHLPVGYHGRAGTVVVSGTPVVRPYGLRKAADDSAPEYSTPEYGASTRLDIEAEVGFVVGVPSTLGERVGVDAVDEHVFGVVLVNDWSARDIQAYEYVPLGPFLGKSFATSVSPWVVPLEALRSARVPPPEQHPQPADYLRASDPWGLDLTLEVVLNGSVVSRPPFASTYWTAAQQLAHLTVNGASLRTGDLYASGTVSGPEPDQRGSLIELTWNATEPLTLADGSTRGYLEDGDTVVITAWADGEDGARIGFGGVAGTVMPAR